MISEKVLAVVGSVCLVLATTLVLCWNRIAVRLKREKKIQFRVERDAKAAAQRRARVGGRLLSFLDLDQDAARSGSLSNMRLLSLGDYFASLSPKGIVSWERAVVSIADRFGLSAALPLALFLPSQWRADKPATGLLRSFPSQAACRLGTTALSTLDLMAFSQTVHLQLAEGRRSKSQGISPDAAQRAADAQQALQARMGPLDILRAGQKINSGAPALPLLASPLLLSSVSVLAQLGLTEEDATDTSPAPAPPPQPLGPVLPDLYLGNGGLTLNQCRARAALCRLMAVVANRLTANALTGLAPSVAKAGAGAGAPPAAGGSRQEGAAELFSVRLREGGPLLSSLEALLDGLREAGHSVQLKLSSNLTSFGVGLSVRGADGSWQQVPLVYPLRCSGLWADVNGTQQDIITLIPHASILLHVSGPQLSFDLEWCLSIEGFTGWLPYVFVDRAWASGDAYKVAHPLGAGAGAEPVHQRQLARLLTAATCVLNTAAQQDGLLFGGYGYVGVCVDSAAAIQQAMCGTCTLFPLVLGGEAKLSLMSLYKAAREQGWEYGEEAASLQAALAALPCDAIQSPCSAAGAARRALACLPHSSVFAGVAACREMLQAALAAAEELCPS